MNYFGVSTEIVTVCSTFERSKRHSFHRHTKVLPIDVYKLAVKVKNESEMATNSEFVLDEGLDDDEDILAFHTLHSPLRAKPPASQHPSNEHGPPVPTTPPSERTDAPVASPTSQTPPCTPPPASPPVNTPTSIIIEGLPITAKRADLDKLLGPSPITSLRLTRLEEAHRIRVHLTYPCASAAEAALEKDGVSYLSNIISIKRATPAPWSALLAAREAADRLEARARAAATALEQRLKQSAAAQETAVAIERIDRTYNVSGRVSEAARAGKETADGLDKAVGFSAGVGKVARGVGGAARIVAGEVEENLRVGERARAVFDCALKDERVGGVVGKVMGRGAPGGKNYQPVGVPADQGQQIEQNEADTPFSAARVEVGE